MFPPIPFSFSLNPIATILRSLYFYAPRTSSITQSRGSGTPTITRATTATVMGYAAAATLADGQTLLTVASGELRHEGARRVSEGVWSTVDADGVPIPSAELKGEGIEAAATQYLGVTGTPATQTTASLGTGTYTLWCDGAGSCIASAGTATITGESAASQDTPNTFTVTVAGTVTVTVTGALTRFNLTNTAYQTSYVENTGAAGTNTTRNADIQDDQVSGNLTAAAGSVAFTWTPSHDPSGTIALAGSYVDASNYTQLLAKVVTNYALQSQTFGTTWVKMNVGDTLVENNAIGLSGDLTADTLTLVAGTTQKGLMQPVTITAGVVTVTAYMRPDTHRYIQILTNQSSDSFANFDLQSGAVLDPVGGTATMELLPSGVYKCVSSFTSVGGTNLYVIAVDSIAATRYPTTASTGNLIYVAVQLETGVSLSGPYVATTTAAASATFAIWRKVIAAAAYDAYISHEYANGTSAKVALYWGANGTQLAVDGVLGTAHANGDPAQLGTRWQWGSDGNGGQQAGAAIKEMYLAPRALSDSELMAITA